MESPRKKSDPQVREPGPILTRTGIHLTDITEERRLSLRDEREIITRYLRIICEAVRHWE